MKATLISLLALIATPMLHALDVETGRAGDHFMLKLQLDARSERPGRDRELIITPVLRAIDSNDSLVMNTVRIAGRNRYYTHLRMNDLPAGEQLVEAGSRNNADITVTLPWEPWMDHSILELKRSTACCCDAPVADPTQPLALLDYRLPPVTPPIEYVALTGDDTVEMEAEGQAFIDFVVNRTELKPDYRGNRAEIDKIISSIDRVANDPDAIITRITIKGYASPEGSYSNNVRLSMGRTNTLKEYVRAHYNFDPEIMLTDYEPEDWQGLRRYVESSDIDNRDAILAIIDDTTLEPDPRNAAIQSRYPAQYAFLLKEVYPALRHSDYTVRYSIKTTVDVDHLKEVFVQDPRRLRPVDFYLIANTYPVGSEKYNETMLTAATVYPADEQAAINAANIHLAAGDLQAAYDYVLRAGHSPEAIYTRGNIATRRGDLTAGRALMQQAAEQGYAPATAAIELIDEVLGRNPVTYF